jgi:hypothetical protein
MICLWPSIDPATWHDGHQAQIIDKLTLDRTESNREHGHRTESPLIAPETESPWKRLGRLLAERRTELGARYRNKNLFAEERQINRRMLWSVESGDRGNYGKETVRLIESAYVLVPGSIERTVAGGDLEPLTDRRAALAARGDVPPPLFSVSDDDAVLEKVIAALADYFADVDVIRAIAAQPKPARARLAEIALWLSLQDPKPQAANGTAG